MDTNTLDLHLSSLDTRSTPRTTVMTERWKYLHEEHWAGEKHRKVFVYLHEIVHGRVRASGADLTRVDAVENLGRKTRSGCFIAVQDMPLPLQTPCVFVQENCVWVQGSQRKTARQITTVTTPQPCGHHSRAVIGGDSDIVPEDTCKAPSRLTTFSKAMYNHSEKPTQNKE